MKAARYIFITLVSSGIIAFGFISVIASGSNGKTLYTESDFLTYHMLTDNEIKKAPRVSDDYYFEYQPGDGYAPSNTVIYNNTINAAPLKAYLSRNGYQLQPKKFGESEVWTQSRDAQTATVYLWVNRTAQQVRLSKEID